MLQITCLDKPQAIHMFKYNISQGSLPLRVKRGAPPFLKDEGRKIKEFIVQVKMNYGGGVVKLIITKAALRVG